MKNVKIADSALNKYLKKCKTLPDTNLFTDCIQQALNDAQPTNQVEQIVRAEDVLIRKWHPERKEYVTTSLKELWMNGLHNGQMLMDSQLNKSYLKKKSEYLSGEGFYATELFVKEILDSFWFSLENAEIILLK